MKIFMLSILAAAIINGCNHDDDDYWEHQAEKREHISEIESQFKEKVVGSWHAVSYSKDSLERYNEWLELTVNGYYTYSIQTFQRERLVFENGATGFGEWGEYDPTTETYALLNGKEIGRWEFSCSDDLLTPYIYFHGDSDSKHYHLSNVYHQFDGLSANGDTLYMCRPLFADKYIRD